MNSKPTYEELLERVKELERQNNLLIKHKKEKLAELNKKSDALKQKEQSLSFFVESEEKFRTFYNNAPLSYQSLDENGNFIDINPTWLNTLGYQREEVVGKNYADFLHLDWVDHFHKNFPEFKRRGYVHDVHFRLKHKKGHFIDVLFEGCIGYYPDGNFRQTYCVFKDITKQKAAEEKLKISEEKYRLLIENQTDLIVKVDTEGRFEFVSPSYCKLFGKKEEELIGQNFMPLVHKDDLEITARAMENLYKPPYSAYVEQRAMTKDGWKWLGWIDTSILDDEGRVVSIIGVGRDIMDRKITEQALRESESKYRVLVETASDAIYLVSDKGIILDTNESACVMLGKSKEEIIAHQIESLDPNFSTKEFLTFWKNIPTNEQRIIETTHQKKDGTFVPVEISSKKFKVGKKLFYFGIARDITQRKQGEHQIKEGYDLLNNLAAQVPGVIYQYRLYPDGKSAFPYSSPGMYDIYEVTSEEVRQDASPVFTRLHPDDIDTIVKTINESAQNQTDYFSEFRVILPEQGLRWRQCYAKPELMADGSTLWHGIILDITERKLVQEKLKEQQLLFETMFNTINEGVVITNTKREIIHANNGMETTFGYKPEDIIGLTTKLLYASEFNYSETGKEVFNSEANEADNKYITYYKTKNNTIFPGETFGTKLYNSKGEWIGNIGIIRNISERIKFIADLKIAKENAEKSEIRLQRMFDKMNSGVAIYKPTKELDDFVIIDFNKAAERITNSKKENIIGKTLLGIFPNMSKAPLYTALKQIVKSSEDIYLPPFYYKDNIGQGWRENYIYKLPTGEIVTIFDDVTFREEAKLALIESEYKFRTIFEMAEDMICIADTSTAKFISINPSFSRILGYSEKELLERPFLDFIHPEDLPNTKNLIKDELENGNTVLNFVNRYRCKDGSYRWLEWNLHPIKEKMITYAIAHDITEIKNYQRELEKHKNNLEILVNQRTQQLEKTVKELKDTELQLIQSEKMASLGILTAGVAHEINNPLNYIQSGVYGLKGLLKQEFEKEIFQEKTEKIIEIIQTGIRKAVAIVKSLNTFSRKAGELKRECNIHEIINNCLLILNHEIKNNCIINKHFTNEIFVLEGSEENLHQVFINLIMNALHAMPTKGEITITSLIDKLNNQIEIKISDNGEGISKENLKMIFDPFFTTKDPGKGVGLGLSIVYKIIKEHNGTINFESELSKGTDVVLKFPVKI